MTSVAVLVLSASLLLGIGCWGRRHADRLLAGHLPPSLRERKKGGLLRGALACIVAGTGLLVLAGMEVLHLAG